MLIAQNSNGAAIAKQFDCLVEAFLAIEHLDAGASPHATHVFIDEAIAQPLIDGAVSDVADVFRQDVRE